MCERAVLNNRPSLKRPSFGRDGKTMMMICANSEAKYFSQ
jgi:hypothetical protein